MKAINKNVSFIVLGSVLISCMIIQLLIKLLKIIWQIAYLFFEIAKNKCAMPFDVGCYFLVFCLMK
jgi:hypothetical protein